MIWRDILPFLCECLDTGETGGASGGEDISQQEGEYLANSHYFFSLSVSLSGSAVSCSHRFYN